MDAVAEAKRFGIDEERAVNYKCDEEGTRVCYGAISDMVTLARTSFDKNVEYGAALETITDDYHRRNKKSRR